MSISFHPTTDTQKKCIPPLLNPTFEENAIPLLNYTNQMKTGKRNNACADDLAPYLFWDEDNQKYCCSSDIQDVELVLNKIKQAIELQVQNSCSLALYNRYKPYITALVRDYIAIYKKKIQSFVGSDEELEELVVKKKAELIELSTYKQDDTVSCSDNPEDLGEDDQALMENLYLAQENAPKRSSSHFFDRRGGRFSQKKSKKQTNIRKFRKSSKRFKH